MAEHFSVACPGCGEEKKHMTDHAGQIGVHCSCGVSFSVDIEARDVNEWWER
ncbi:hypothetical protein ACFPM1_07825 [Halorubrum rubrum]|uniref:Transcription factor zinc-finger domain-containing protein n=1 Tax=Halorubrum rubrum TaxID=1126240 RepID=A0ABD5R180_9EURY|nr:hypothetical protein [Halorubrum rubrum]